MAQNNNKLPKLMKNAHNVMEKACATFVYSYMNTRQFHYFFNPRHSLLVYVFSIRNYSATANQNKINFKFAICRKHINLTIKFWLKLNKEWYCSKRSATPITAMFTS